MKILKLGLLMAAVSLMLPSAKADLLYTGSQAGLCCFDVNLHQASATDVQVTVSLTGGAQWFVDTGGGQHPGFAFNLINNPVITISNLSSPWTPSDVHVASVTTGGPALGTFDYYIDNPGSGASSQNPGPLTFDVTLGTGISINDFVSNSAGNLFVADIMDANGKTGESAIGLTEPSTSLMLLSAGLALIFLRRRAAARP